MDKKNRVSDHHSYILKTIFLWGDQINLFTASVPFISSLYHAYAQRSAATITRSSHKVQNKISYQNKSKLTYYMYTQYVVAPITKEVKQGNNVFPKRNQFIPSSLS